MCVCVCFWIAHVTSDLNRITGGFFQSLEAPLLGSGLCLRSRGGGQQPLGGGGGPSDVTAVEVTTSPNMSLYYHKKPGLSRLS